MQLFTGPTEHALSRRFWVGGTWLGLVVLTTVVMLVGARDPDGSKLMSLGGDFVPAYAAGTLVRLGQPLAVYDESAIGAIERQIVEDARLEPLPFYGPYLNPPFFAAAYAPLSALPYRTAAGVWLAINLACIAGALALLVGMLPVGTSWRNWGLAPLLLLISMPFWQTICHLQNTGVSLFLVCGTVACWRAGRNRLDVLGGLICGLLFYKPQLAVAIAGGFCLTRGWRVSAGCAASGASLLALTLMKWPGTLSAYLHQLPIVTQEIQNRPTYNWGRQVTLRGFWRLVLQGHIGGTDLLAVKAFTAMMVVIGLAALGYVIWRHVRRRSQTPRADRVIAATIASMPLLMPYYMDYDLLLLAIPAVLLAAEWIKPGWRSTQLDRALVVAWSILFVMLYLNPGISGPTRVNFAAVLSALIAAGTIARCLVPDSGNCEMIQPDVEPMRAAA
jgi:hypothetical protein